MVCEFKDKCKKYINNECDLEVSGFCLKVFKINYLYEQSLLSETQRKYIDLRIDADGTDRDAFKKLKEIENNIEQFVSNAENLYIHSSICGNGKTAWAIRLLQSYIKAIWYKSDLSCKALYVNVPRFLLSLKDSIGSTSSYIDFIKENIFNADLVIWDEIGIKSPTQFEFENLLNLINTRIDKGKSNIYTSNLTNIQLRDVMGERLYSRILHLSTDIEFFGKDKRNLNREH